ncbi:cation transporter [Francisella tularensis]|uniref:cation transporter n=1 Tax=Francisella tularensis TaxID=263 RepID=UPI00295A6A29|nr:cation transporter [Francisella tularensis]
MVVVKSKYGNKSEDPNHPYVHVRLEALATLVFSGLVISFVFIIVYHSLLSILCGEFFIPDKFNF